MFKKSDREQQLGLFSNTDSLLSGRSKNYYVREDGWHNLFRNQVTMQIDEPPYSPLYSEKMGAPNASIRVLISMMILKEANGWSDELLFEGCRYNLLVRSALGLFNIDDEIPTESTYYLLRKRIVEHEKEKGVNLLEKTFADITEKQAIEFEVSGKSIRMDSKLLGSNIAWYSRYELVHETLRLFYKSIQSPKDLLETDLFNSLNNVLKEEGNKVVYRSSREEVKTKLGELGLLIDRLIQVKGLPRDERYDTLYSVFTEQFEVKEDDSSRIVVSKAKEDIKANSVQSPYDTDCHYRNKDGNQVKGYSINLTESCDKDELHLISDVNVKPVTAPDNSFLQQGIKQSKEVFSGEAEKLYADGAYHSKENQSYCKEEDIHFYLQAIQGKKGRYDLALDEQKELKITDTLTGKIIPTTKIKAKEGYKWRMKTESGSYRYFTQAQIDASELRKQIEVTPREELNIRNNVEASIFQLGYHYPHDKSRYRGLIKHRMWAFTRCLWVNFVRVMKYVGRLCPKPRKCKGLTSANAENDRTYLFFDNIRQIFINTLLYIIMYTGFMKISPFLKKDFS